MHKFLFEAKQQRFFLWHTICKSKSKRNQIKKLKQKT